MTSFFEALDPSVSGCCLALSGGLDSTVLMHSLSTVQARAGGLPLRAIHVNHGLHADAGRWAEHCEALCAELGVPLAVLTVEVDAGCGGGLEAAARAARYAALAKALRTGECLLTAHHQEDQLETVLLRLMRGTGIDGLAGIPDRRRFAKGWLQRPLIDVPQAEILAYAQRHDLTWIEDPSNQDEQPDRNFMRLRVIPLLRERWPGLAATTARTARIARDTQELLDDLALLDEQGSVSDDSINLHAFRKLSGSRQINLARHLIRKRGLSMPSEVQLRQGIEQLVSAGADRLPVMRWEAGQLRRYRDRLYLLDTDPDRVALELPTVYAWRAGAEALDLGPLRGRLRIQAVDQGGMRLPETSLQVRFRSGGETIKGAGHVHHASLKKLFQAWGILPWMRAHVPLIFAGDRLICIADLMIAADAVAAGGEPGYHVRWEGHAECRSADSRN